MYLGEVEIRYNIYTDKSIRSGIRYRTMHSYQCGRCGRSSNVLQKADEPFFCGGCGSLIGIDPALKRWVVLYHEPHAKPLDFDAFICEAEDMEHAESQFEDACPDCDAFWVSQSDTVLGAVGEWQDTAVS